ncbi:MAG TPA: DegT/DnrJ/EryC1/StrS family aminotransferase [Candidatus Sulfotelmatobacter sp.]|nr:DegT/DnrJ/EryC1/StrS family aminotransferase [Candidatus Sulfotelmatobacter sp.]
MAPSARFGVYATAKALLSPGDRVLISPITCHTVIDALLRAGVVPMFANIDLASGNIDVGRLSRNELGQARAIVTTNLYGNPDAVEDLSRMARSSNLLLIEDCAHVLHTRVGAKEIGSFGDVSIFSFKKHFDLPGGVVCVRETAAAAKLELCIASESIRPNGQEEILRYSQLQLANATGPDFALKVSGLYRNLRFSQSLKENQETPKASNSVTQAAFIRTLPTTATLLHMRANVHHWSANIRERKFTADNLIARCPLRFKGSKLATEVIHLAVPFTSPKCEVIIAGLRARGVPTYFLYSPPMNRAFRSRVPSNGLDEDRINEWYQDILPVLPQHSQQFLEVIEDLAPFDPGHACHGIKDRQLVASVAKTGSSIS